VRKKRKLKNCFGQQSKEPVKELGWFVRLLSLLLIPLCYIIASVLFDVVTFSLVGWELSYGYLLSFFMIVFFAVLVSLIPSRVAQLCIFAAILSFNAVILYGNVIAFTMLDELFVFENALAVREALAGADSVNIVPWAESLIVAAILIPFMVISIITARKFRRHRAGYRWKGLLASLVMVVIVVGGFVGTFFATPRHADNLVDNLSNRRFQLNNFNFNRHMFLRNFGPSMFYARNLIEMVGLGPAFSAQGLYGDFDFQLNANSIIEIDGVQIPFLTYQHNLIMLMMEAVEFDAINPLLMPNLSWAKGRSMWVDGVHSHERTHPNEYTALTGSHLTGQEMWSNFTEVYRPHALPQIFRRAGHDQVAAFHPYNREFYRRDRMARPDRLGFDFLRDMNDFDKEIHFEMELNSDYLFFQTMAHEMVPATGSFFSYILPLSTHTPHMTSRAVFPKRDANGRIMRETNGRQVLTSAPQFQQSFDFVTSNMAALEAMYPRLLGSDKERRGVVAYLTALRDFDRGLGVLLQRLHDTGQINNTAIVIFSDHFNYGAYIEPYNAGRGGLLSSTGKDCVIGEQIPFMIFHPEDQVERRIVRFASTLDVYRTVTHLFNIQTSQRFTNGTSIFTGEPSVGIGFITGFYFGICHENGPWRTRDMRRFEGAMPSQATLSAIRPTLERQLATLLYLRPLYERNAFALRLDARYTIPRI